jgi:hypothetical protein
VVLREVYGDPFDVNIYIGEITHVGNKYFEHNINTFPGCSGAIVFLVDRNQSALVQQRDLRKAIGVHAGFKPQLQTNIAFNLTVLKRSKWWWIPRRLRNFWSSNN